MDELLPLVWLIFLGLSITFYVLLDGFSLGIGILFRFAKTDHDRDLMMASVAPVWDGNQTWLVGGGMALFMAFPKAFHLLLSALYLPLMIMVIALVFRGVAFEFRFKAEDKTWWDRAFIGGSTVAAFCQGLVLGTLVMGFDYDGQQLQVNALDFISPFSLMTGVAVVCAYGLLGACWLIIKTEQGLQQWARQAGQWLLVPVTLAVLAVSLWTPLAVPEIHERWFSWPNIALLSPIPIWTAAAMALLLYGLRRPQRWEPLPFFACIGMFLITLAGLAISLWPYIVPRVFSFQEVAAPNASLLFTLIGVLFIVPVILLYTAHSYYVFRGKVSLQDVYH